MMEIERRNNIRYLMASPLVRTGVAHAFGTRDFGRRPVNVHARIKMLFPEIKAIVTVHQIHGKRAVSVRGLKEAASLRAGHVNADIITVSAPGIVAAVRTADCTPVLLHDPVRRVAAAVHAGWRGTVAGAPAEAAALLVRDYGSRIGDLQAGIGPCIGPCHYQVDAPVIDGIKSALGAAAEQVLAPDGPGHARLDLSRANRLLLEQAGLPAENIAEARRCTYCHPDLFYSYRREGKGVPSLYHFIFLTDEIP